jgi:hypothetical protein
MTTNDNEKSSQSSAKFCCDSCHYSSSRKSQYDRHLSTQKHIKTTNDNEKWIQSSAKKYLCVNCDKQFNDRAGLWRHNKKCANLSNDLDKELVMMLIKQTCEVMKQNSEFMKETCELKSMMMEVIKTGTHNTTNSHNKTFNLNFFLNDTCKGAMNLTEFVDLIKLQVSDLEKVGKDGYVDGISNIITTSLKALHITQRPIHCTDNKREVLYVKDENKWEKESEDKHRIRKAIKIIASKNMKMLPKFKEIHPDCIKSESKYSDQYNKIMVESFGGDGEKDDQIIKNISKGVILDKTCGSLC